MGDKRRFSKALALQALDMRSSRIARTEGFDRSGGTRQLDTSGKHDELVRRAVEYGRMRAFEQFACAIEEGFEFEGLPK